MRTMLIVSAIKILCIVIIIVSAVGWLITQPTFRKNRISAVTADTERLKAHVRTLSQTLHPRDWRHVDNLNRCADYITAHFTEAGAAIEPQVFTVQGRQYRNVIGRFGVGRGNKVVLGAHYDAFEGTPGADDNASGVATLIEVAYLLGRDSPPREVELVAYVLEEPPFFRTPLMGSAVHAQSIAREKASIAGVIVLEMVGYFSDKRGSQLYPVPFLRLLYPSRGNYLMVVGSSSQGEWVKTVKVGMKATTNLSIYSIRAPTVIPGVDFSDHLNYWPYGIPAVMITDTAFYRNMVYHTAGDTAERLDYDRMSKVVVAVFESIRSP